MSHAAHHHRRLRICRTCHSACISRGGMGIEALVEWARDSHTAFMAGMATLEDEHLAEMTTKWHGARDTKAEVIAVIIQHDCYHAGEINHLRAIHQHRDTE